MEKQIAPLMNYRNRDGTYSPFLIPGQTVQLDYHFGGLEGPDGNKLTPMLDTEKYEVRYYENSNFETEPWRRSLAAPSPGFDVVTVGRPVGAPALFCYQVG